MSFGNPQVISSAGSSVAPSPSPQTPPVLPPIQQAIYNVPLVNGTPTFLSAQAPNDGRPHKVTIYITCTVTVAATGGIINATFTRAGVTGLSGNIIGGGGKGVGVYQPLVGTTFIVDPGTTISLAQTALTAGSAQVDAEIDIV